MKSVTLLFSDSIDNDASRMTYKDSIESSLLIQMQWLLAEVEKTDYNISLDEASVTLIQNSKHLDSLSFEIGKAIKTLWNVPHLRKLFHQICRKRVILFICKSNKRYQLFLC
jgi:hypothetical protein